MSPSKKRKKKSKLSFEEIVTQVKRAHLEEYGEKLSVRDLAAEWGLAHGTIHNIMNGVHWPTDRTLCAIAEGLGMDIDTVESAIGKGFDLE